MKTNQRLACPERAVARKVRAGQEALAAGDADRALVLAEAACEGSVPAAEPAVRLRVEALLHLGRWEHGDDQIIIWGPATFDHGHWIPVGYTVWYWLWLGLPKPATAQLSCLMQQLCLFHGW